MFSVDFATIIHMILAILTFLSGGAGGWLLHARSGATPDGSPLDPLGGGAGGGGTGDIMNQLNGLLAKAGLPTGYNGLGDQVAKQSLFQQLVRVILSLPLDPNGKGRVLRQLLEFLDNVFAQPAPPPVKPSEPPAS